MLTRIPGNPNSYDTACVPIRFEGDHIVFECATRISSEDPFSTMYSEGGNTILSLEVPINLSDSDSIGELRREALEIYRATLDHAARAAEKRLAK